MQLALIASVAMLVIKWIAYLLTGSAAIFSDAAESIVHLGAIAFAYYSLHLVEAPPDADHHFGHAKIAYFSSAIEGVLILIAAGIIIYESISKWFHGLHLESLGIGTALTAAAGIVNAFLGWHLVRVGRKHHSIVLSSNGKHILTDSWTSAGVVIGLLGAWATGWLVLDPIFAILSAAQIIVTGVGLVRGSVKGLMDQTDPELESRIREVLDVATMDSPVQYHRLRLRMGGKTAFCDFHLWFPPDWTIQRAHDDATLIENKLKSSIPVPLDVQSHLEVAHDHDHDE